MTTYAAGFNAMVVRRPILETTEREEVMEALGTALTDAGVEGAEHDRLWNLADGLREF